MFYIKIKKKLQVVCERWKGGGGLPTCQRGELVDGFVKHWREKQNGMKLQCCPLLSLSKTVIILRQRWSAGVDTLNTLL